MHKTRYKAIVEVCVTVIFAMLLGCGTDLKPSTYVNIFRDPSDIDDLAQCINEPPTIEGDTITVRADKQCLIDFSIGDVSDDLTLDKILINPTAYLAKEITFRAEVKGVRLSRNAAAVEYPRYIYLYTNTVSASFTIHNPREVPVEIQVNQTYDFTCRIYEIKRQADHGGILEIQANFITNAAGEIEHLPVLVW